MTNHLYYGDNLAVLRNSIASESVDLICLDPPFNSNASYNVLFKGASGEDTRTPLQMWFYAIYLYCTTRHGVSGKELQRQLGVTYKTAWRMAKHIRVLMEKADPSDQFLSGHVEIDEAYVGGKRSGGKRGRGAPGKTIVMGFKERGGRMVATVIPDVKLQTLRAETLARVEPGSIVSTDELMSYGLLEREGYSHFAVKHGAKEWSLYDYRTKAWHHMNNVQNFWRHFKNAIRSTHIHVSGKHMPTYLATSPSVRTIATRGMRCWTRSLRRCDDAPQGVIKVRFIYQSNALCLMFSDELG